MVKLIKAADGSVTLMPGLKSPTVYIDYGALADLSETELGPKLRDTICQRGGTLYLSWAHFIELFSLRIGPTYERISAYLASFGPNFIVIDPDANRVIGREQQWTPEKQNPAIDEEWIYLLMAKWAKRAEETGLVEVSVGLLMDYMTSEPSLVDHIKALHLKHKQNMKALFDAKRDSYRTDKQVKKQLDSIKYAYESPFVTGKVIREVTRECVRTQEEFVLSDGLDFHHSVVSISYCDYVVLDKKWTHRCNRLKLPKPQTATILNGSQIDQLLALMEESGKKDAAATNPGKKQKGGSS